MRPYRSTFTVTRNDDGTFVAKVHGYPFYHHGATAEECMSHAGRVMDTTAKFFDQAVAAMDEPNPGATP